MTDARINMQTDDNLDIKLLKTLNHEKCKLEALIHEAHSTKLHNIFSADEGKLASENINNSKQKLDNELKKQLLFINNCNKLIDDFEVRLKKHKSKPNFFRSPITKDFLIKDMNFMLETIKLTHQVISKPQEAAQLLPSFNKHLSDIKVHLKDEQMLTKTRNIWSGIIYALGLILSIIIFSFPIMFAVASLGLVYGGSMAATAIGFTSYNIAKSMFSHAPAKKQVELCTDAQKLNGMQPTK